LHKLILLAGLDREHIDESNRDVPGLMVADGMQTSTGKRYAALLANPGRKISRHETFSISMRMDGSYRRGGTFERAFCSIHGGATAQTRVAAHETEVDHYRRTQRGFELRLVPVPAWPATEGAPRMTISGRSSMALTSPDAVGTGNGLLLFIRVDNFDEVLKRARGVAGRLAGEPYVNPNTGTMELSLRDPDGYYVSISAADKD
jgi:hypothetical protein